MSRFEYKKWFLLRKSLFESAEYDATFFSLLFPVKNHPTWNQRLNFVNLDKPAYLKNVFFSSFRSLGALSRSFILGRSRPPKINQDAEVLIVSHHVDSGDDVCSTCRYFGEFPRHLAAELGSVVEVVRLDHLNNSGSEFEKLIGYRVSRYETLVFLAKALQASISMFVTTRKDLSVGFRVFLFLDSISSTSYRAFVIQRSILKLIEQANIRSVFLTYEGHSWERGLVRAVKGVKRPIKVIGYCHGAVLPSQGALAWKNDYCPLPDKILLAGKGGEGFLQTALGSDAVSISGRFANKHLSVGQCGDDVNKVLSRAGYLFVCDGEDGEVESLVDFVANAADNTVGLELYLKFHPVTESNEKKTASIVSRLSRFSSVKVIKSIKEGALRSSHVFYRGSTAVLEAMQFGCIPVSWGDEDALEIDVFYGKGLSCYSSADAINYEKELFRFVRREISPSQYEVLMSLLGYVYSDYHRELIDWESLR